MDAKLTQALRIEIDAALALIAEKHGMRIHAGNCSYTPTSCTYKLECAERSEDGIVLDTFAQSFKSYAAEFGLKPEWLGRVFQSGPTRYQIVGLNLRKSMPLLALNLTTGVRHAFRVTPAVIAILEKGV